MSGGTDQRGKKALLKKKQPQNLLQRWIFVLQALWHEHQRVLAVISTIVGGVLIVIAFVSTAVWATWAATHPRLLDGTFKDFFPKKEQKSSVLPRRLDGMLVSAKVSNILPACVIIENATFGGVRPQSGLSRALVVYEVIVEGGITRLMAVFGGESSDRIGPVRSGRDTYLEFVSEYNCMFSHAGGSFTAALAIPRFGIRNNDALWEPGFFWRDPHAAAPHNLFTSSELLDKALFHWRAEPAPSFTPWYFVDALPPQGEQDTTGEHVTIRFGGASAYDVEYRYVPAKKYYERWNGGTLQTDAVNGEIISARNVVIQKVGVGDYIEGKGRVNWPVTGEGEVIVYREGRKTVGRWKKMDRQARTEFLDDHGNPLPLVRGNTWVEIVPPHIVIDF